MPDFPVLSGRHIRLEPLSLTHADALVAAGEGVLRAHRMAADFIPRDSYSYSIVSSEWPELKRRFVRLRARN